MKEKKVNKLIKYFTERKLIRINSEIGEIEGELTYYEILRRDAQVKKIFPSEEGLIAKLDNLYYIKNKLRILLPPQNAD